MTQISIIFLILFMAVTLAEFFLSSSWTPAYFRFGLSLYQTQFKLADVDVDLTGLIPQWEKQLRRAWAQPAVAFKAIGNDELGFRQKFGQRNPVHGRVYFDPRKQTLTITGYLYWSIIVFPLWFTFLFTMIGIKEWTFLLAFVGLNFFLLTTMIITQRRSYSRISRVIRDTYRSQIVSYADTIEPVPYVFTEDTPPAEPQPYDPITTSSDYPAPPKSETNWLENALIFTLIVLIFLAGLLFTFFLMQNGAG